MPPAQPVADTPPDRAPARSGVVSEEWLLRRYKQHGDRAARDELVRQLMPLVRRVVGAHAGRSHGEDLWQVACLGLVKAIDRYDPAFGTPLRAYAVPTMTGEVRRYLRDHSWAVRPPRSLQERVLSVSHALERLTAAGGRSPSPQALADELDLTLEEVLEALTAGEAHRATSLDAPVGSEGDERATVADGLGQDDPRLALSDEIAELHRLRGLLDDRAAEVMYLRFVRDLTQSEIARRVGVSQMQVSRILKRSLAALQQAAAVGDAA